GDVFLSSSFWTNAYVGAGPYRLERWDPGVQLIGRAFGGDGLGPPKIDQIVVRLFSDEAATLSAILAGGQIDYSCCRALRFEHFVTLKREWEPSGKGKAVAAPGDEAFLFLQQAAENGGETR